MMKLLAPIRYFFIGLHFIFTNVKILLVLVVCLFISLLRISSGYREEIIKMEQEMLYEKVSPNINYYYDDVDVTSGNDNSAVDDLIDCYKNGGNLENGADKVIKYVDDLKALYNKNSGNFSFLYHDLFSGFTVSYNAEAPIFTASAIKAPAMIYLYEMASQGKINLDDKLVYTSNYYSGGSGVLKNRTFNTSYTVEELIQYTIYNSDNIAYRMLVDKFGRKNIYDFWNKLGTNYIFSLDTIWGVMSAKDAAIYMKELYRFSEENDDYGIKILNHFKKAEWKLITDKNGKFNTANKGGWSGSAIHDIAIVFDKNPYILIIMSNLGESNYLSLFNETSKMVGLLHEEYWKYKIELCSNINLY